MKRLSGASLYRIDHRGMRAFQLSGILIEAGTLKPDSYPSHPIDSHISTAYAVAPTSALHERGDLCRDDTVIVCTQ